MSYNSEDKSDSEEYDSTFRQQADAQDDESDGTFEDLKPVQQPEIDNESYSLGRRGGSLW
jgi:hypothetical protein